MASTTLLARHNAAAEVAEAAAAGVSRAAFLVTPELHDCVRQLAELEAQYEYKSLARMRTKALSRYVKYLRGAAEEACDDHKEELLLEAGRCEKLAALRSEIEDKQGFLWRAVLEKKKAEKALRKVEREMRKLERRVERFERMMELEIEMEEFEMGLEEFEMET
jgi:hypothetical protein